MKYGLFCLLVLLASFMAVFDSTATEPPPSCVLEFFSKHIAD